MHPIDIIYWICLALGGMYTVITVLMGGLSHVAGHAGEIGHALHLPQLTHHGPAGHVGPAAIDHGSHAGSHPGVHSGSAHGGHHAGNGHVHAEPGQDGRTGGHLDVHVHPEHAAGGGFNLLAYLNPMSVAGFLLGFGGAGAASRVLGAPVDASLLYSGAGGLGIYTGAYLILSKLFVNSQASSHTRREEIIGLRAKVTAPISGSLPGMVSYTIAGSRQSVSAITEDEDPIPVGAIVRIRRIEGHRAQVMRID